MNTKEIANTFVLEGLQNYEQTDKEIIQAWQKVMDFMGLSVEVDSKVIDGKSHFLFGAYDQDDLEAAVAFEKEIKQRFPIGQFQDEVEMVEECIEKYGKLKKDNH